MAVEKEVLKELRGEKVENRMLVSCCWDDVVLVNSVAV